MTDGQLMGAVRKYLYVNGPPVNWNPARDASIIKMLKRRGLTGQEIYDRIRGANILRERGELWIKPGESMTMEVFVKAQWGGKQLDQLAEATYHKSLESRHRTKTTTAIGDALAHLVNSLPTADPDGSPTTRSRIRNGTR